MGKLAAMDALANREAAKLDIDVRINVIWKSGCPTNSRWSRNTFAHAHCYPKAPAYGTICIRPGLSHWRDTIKHEAAHFVRKGKDHDNIAFLEARAKQGSKTAARYLVQKGKRRCPKHNWMRGQVIEEKTTSRGLLVLYESHCINCGRNIP